VVCNLTIGHPLLPTKVITKFEFQIFNGKSI
jgi:hypothetical protein